MDPLGIYEMERQGPYILKPFLDVGGVVQEEFGPTRGIMYCNNSLVIRHVGVIRSFL